MGDTINTSKRVGQSPGCNKRKTTIYSDKKKAISLNARSINASGLAAVSIIIENFCEMTPSKYVMLKSTKVGKKRKRVPLSLNQNTIIRRASAPLSIKLWLYYNEFSEK